MLNSTLECHRGLEIVNGHFGLCCLKIVKLKKANCYIELSRYEKEDRGKSLAINFQSKSIFYLLKRNSENAKRVKPN